MPAARRITQHLSKTANKGVYRESKEQLTYPLPLPSDFVRAPSMGGIIPLGVGVPAALPPPVRLAPSASAPEAPATPAAAAAPARKPERDNPLEVMQRSQSYSMAQRPDMRSLQHSYSANSGAAAAASALADEMRKLSTVHEGNGGQPPVRPAPVGIPAHHAHHSSRLSGAGSVGSPVGSHGPSRLAPPPTRPPGPLVIPALQLGTCDDVDSSMKPGFKERVKSYLQQQAGGEERL